MTNYLILKLGLLADLIRVALSEAWLFLKQRSLANQNLNQLFPLVRNSQKPKTLLVINLSNMNYNVCIESLMAKAFSERGYKVVFLTNWSNKRAAKTFCFLGGQVLYHYWLFIQKGFVFLTKRLPLLGEIKDLKNYEWEGVNIGNSVIGSLAAKFRVGRLDWQNYKVQKMAQKYLWRSIIYLETAKDIVAKVKPDLAIANDKGYMGSNEIFNWVVKQKIDFIQWCACHESNALMIKRYHQGNRRDHPFSVSLNTWTRLKSQPWNESWQKEVYDIFERGYLGQNWFQYKKLADDLQTISKNELVRKYQLNPQKKIAVLFSHVMWDANLFYGDDLFGEGFEQWFCESAKAMLKNPNVNWLIKIHPANKFKHDLENIQSDYREITALKQTFGRLPKDIKIIYPEDNINPFSLFNIIDYGITVRGTIGAELPCYGVPVLTAGTGRYSGRGFTVDSESPQEYLKRLEHIQDISRLSEGQRRLAILHAYAFFKLRPLKFTSWLDRGFGAQRDVEIKIKSMAETLDINYFADWAVNSQQEDLLNHGL
jgi:hypothetical protein